MPAARSPIRFSPSRPVKEPRVFLILQCHVGQPACSQQVCQPRRADQVDRCCCGPSRARLCRQLTSRMPESWANHGGAKGGAKGIRIPASTRQSTGLPAGSLRLVPIQSRSLPAVLFSGLDGVKAPPLVRPAAYARGTLPVLLHIGVVPRWSSVRAHSQPAVPGIGPGAAGVFAAGDAAGPAGETAADGGLVDGSGGTVCRGGDGGASGGGKITHGGCCGGRGSWRPMQISVQLGPPGVGAIHGNIGG
jgi:hypothetical protein